MFCLFIQRHSGSIFFSRFLVTYLNLVIVFFFALTHLILQYILSPPKWIFDLIHLLLGLCIFLNLSHISFVKINVSKFLWCLYNSIQFEMDVLWWKQIGSYCFGLCKILPPKHSSCLSLLHSVFPHWNCFCFLSLCRKVFVGLYFHLQKSFQKSCVLLFWS